MYLVNNVLENRIRAVPLLVALIITNSKRGLGSRSHVPNLRCTQH